MLKKSKGGWKSDMSKIKFLYQHAIIIAVGILFVVAIEGLLLHFTGKGDEFALQWYHPISMIISGIICAIPSLALEGYEELETRKFVMRIAIHFTLLYCVVMLLGYIFVWYDSVSGFAYVSVAYIVVYIIVWASSIWIYRQDDVKINEALKDIQDIE